jgi:hypothetical protein
MAQLPTFIIAGAMRSGTTSLNGYLREHPQIAVSNPKEVHYFDLNYEKGLDWYCGHFIEAGDADAVGEATPDYLYHPEAIGRIASDLPGVKLLIMLRNPIDRAYSHYWHNRSRGKEPLSFDDAVAAEAERIAQDAESRRVYSYVTRGRYREQLERVLTHFPTDAVRTETFDAMQAEPAAVFAATCRFLGVDDTVRPENLGRPINAYMEFRSPRLRELAKRLPGPLQAAVAKLNTKQASPYPPMAAATRKRLAEELGAANAGLDELVGRPVPAWD